MSTDITHDTTDPSTDHANDERCLPAERAFHSATDRPAWKQAEPNLSAGHRLVAAALHADPDPNPDEVTSS